MSDRLHAGGAATITNLVPTPASHARKVLWRRGDIELWQEGIGDLRSGRRSIGYFVGKPGGQYASFQALPDACLHFWRLTDARTTKTEAKQFRQLELR